MSHFYGKLKGSRGEATRCGTRSSGLKTTAASWDGAIHVYLTANDDGTTHVEIWRTSWPSCEDMRCLDEFEMGTPEKTPEKKKKEEPAPNMDFETLFGPPEMK